MYTNVISKMQTNIFFKKNKFANNYVSKYAIKPYEESIEKCLNNKSQNANTHVQKDANEKVAKHVDN